MQSAKRPGAGVVIDITRLRRLREEKMLSRAELASLMSNGNDEFTYTPDAVAKIENGRRRPKTATLRRLCEVLECVPEDLLPPMSETAQPCAFCNAPSPSLYGHEPGCPEAT